MRHRRREGERKAGEQHSTWNEHPSGALYPELSHSVISAVYLIFSDKDKIRAAYLLLLLNPAMHKQPHRKLLLSSR